MCVAPPLEYAWCQFKMTSSKCPYRSKHQVIILTIYIALKPCTSHKTKHGMLFNGTRIHIVPNSAYLRRFGGDLWWFAYIATRLAAANHHKPPPKHRKYAGFGTKGIRESIMLHRHGLATLPGAIA